MARNVLLAITNTDGTEFISLNPRTVDGPGGFQRSTDLTLYGNNTGGDWGHRFVQNFYRLLENSACRQREPGDVGYDPSRITPVDEHNLGKIGLGINKPIIGQFWTNKTTNSVFVFTGEHWIPICSHVHDCSNEVVSSQHPVNKDPTYIDPIVVYRGTEGTLGWITVDLSDLVPPTSSAVILDMSASCVGRVRGIAQTRPTENHPASDLIIVQSSGQLSNTCGTSRGHYQVEPPCSIQFNIDVGFNDGLEVNLVGYV
jgi:hypothetical protein